MPEGISISLTEETYRRLLILTYLGEWMMNATRKDPDPAFVDVAAKIYALAQGTSSEALTVFDETHGEWAPTDKLETDAHGHIDEYDDKTFWEELTARLIERDLMAKHGERVLRSMRSDQRERAAKPIGQAYSREFETHGLDRLFVMDDDKRR